jgi:hypothetical protein
MSETCQLVAILLADVARYSRLAGADKNRTLARLGAAGGIWTTPHACRVSKSLHLI